MLVGIDIGSTHCKAGRFTTDGAVVRLALRPMPTQRTTHGTPCYDPEALWHTAVEVLQEVIGEGSDDLAALGVTSMAETGLLIDRASGRPRIPMIPWFDTSALPQAELVARREDAYETFRRTGLQPSFKYGVPKILWLREQDAAITRDAVWLSAADYVAYRLTGTMATDPTLAARTYAFRIDQERWDDERIAHLGLDPALFPCVQPSGTPVGHILDGVGRETGLPVGTPVSICGHDHLCGALAAGVTEPGSVLDSMGTAESMVGALDPLPLGEREFRSGLAFGPHVARGRFFWLGGLSAAGGSIEWIRAQIADPPLSYEQLNNVLASTSMEPSGILYFPYLTGSGAPTPDQHVRASFVGLSRSSTRADLLKAVIEGTAYEAERLRRAAEHLTGAAIAELIAIGGGTHNRYWLQVKADVSGCTVRVPRMREATLLGAALAAGIGCGIYADYQAALQAVGQHEADRDMDLVLPDRDRHSAYTHHFEHGYLALQGPLRAFFHRSEGDR